MITIRTIYFFTFVAIFLVSILAVGTYFYLRYRRRQKYPYGEWESLLSRLGTLDRDYIASIATDFIERRDEQGADEEDVDPDRIWRLIGGMEGLETVERNCAVLVDLVFYVQQWYPEALLIAEQLRQNAREVEWHIERLKGAAKAGRLKTAIPDYLGQAVAIYYRMTQEVIALYEFADLPGLTDLQRAL
jgi:hypothetical protein